MRIQICRLVLGLAFFISQSASAALIYQYFIDSTVAIGTERPTSEVGQSSTSQWFTEGTGFLYGYLVKDDPDPTKQQYEIYLVTAGHVVKEHPAKLGDLEIRVNPPDSLKNSTEFVLSQRPTDTHWFYPSDSSIDLAMVKLDYSTMQKNGIQAGFFESNHHVAKRDKLKEIDVAAGDGVFVLGFPMNLTGSKRNYVIVRLRLHCKDCGHAGRCVSNIYVGRLRLSGK